MAAGSACLLASLLQSAPARAGGDPVNAPLRPAPLRPAPLAAPPPEPRPGLVWQPYWRRAHTIDYAATVAFAGAALAEILIAPGDLEGDGWVGGILFDDAVRDALAIRSAGDRKAIGRMSDVLFTALVAYPFVVDTALVTWLGHDSPDVAWQMLVINTRAFAFTQALTGVIKRIANRERPALTECRADPSYDPTCGDGGADYSFFSGHSSMAFTGAALICTHHAHLPLYGGDGDTLACTGAITAAMLTGLARVTSDRHYLSDVLTGASVGMVSGAILPYLLHYRAQGTASEKQGAARGMVSPLIGPTTFGASYTLVY